MKIWKLVLALVLAGGVVFAVLNFPNPLEQAAAENAPAEKPAT